MACVGSDPEKKPQEQKILTVDEGAHVGAGQQIATIEAMKMESTISAPTDGTVERLAVTSGTNVEPGDLLAVLGPG